MGFGSQVAGINGSVFSSSIENNVLVIRTSTNKLLTVDADPFYYPVFTGKVGSLSATVYWLVDPDDLNTNPPEKLFLYVGGSDRDFYNMYEAMLPARDQYISDGQASLYKTEIYLNGGDDAYIAGFYDDEISGGDGNDNIMGDVGDDTIHGDAGNDCIYGDGGVAP